MKLPIVDILTKVVLPLVGKIGKGKMTAAGAITTAIGLGVDVSKGHGIFESLHAVVNLAQQGWPHILVIIGGITAVAGFFRKAGRVEALQNGQQG